MNKARRLIQENLNKVDVVIEILDARVPDSSRNPVIDSIVGEKPRIVVLNKSDLADSEITKKWIEYFKRRSSTAALSISCKTGSNLAAVSRECRTLCKSESWAGTRALRAMIVGIPNVGKSTLINKLLGKKKAAVSNKPAVTRDLQRIFVSKGFELFDTPGVLWHKFEDQQAGLKLAVFGSIKDSILDMQGVAAGAAAYLSRRYPGPLKARYRIDEIPDDPVDLLMLIGKKRGFLISGGNIDYDRACGLLIQEIRDGKLGPLSFDDPPDEKVSGSSS